jgi:hypothetical protein
MVSGKVVDPHWFNADPDADPDPDTAFISKQIRIQGAKPVRTHADQDPDIGRPSK